MLMPTITSEWFYFVYDCVLLFVVKAVFLFFVNVLPAVPFVCVYIQYILTAAN